MSVRVDRRTAIYQAFAATVNGAEIDVSGIDTDGALVFLNPTDGVGDVELQTRITDGDGNVSIWFAARESGTGGKNGAVAALDMGANKVISLAGDMQELRLKCADMSAGTGDLYIYGKARNY